MIGFTVAYFLAFHVRSRTMQMALSLRLHDPVLDLERDPHDLLDPAARPQRPRQPDADGDRARSTQPLEWLLYSDFSVVLAFVHLYTFFMIVPIFNSHGAHRPRR